MKAKIILSIPAVIIYSVGCSAQNPPVETQKPNTDYKSAKAGQTRVAGVKTKTDYKVDKMAEKLGLPWAVTPLPDGRLLITERKGSMQILDANGTVVKKITGFPEVDASGQGGMLDVALDPNFSKNKIIYWSFSEKNGVGNLMAVAKGELMEAESKVQNPVIIFRATPELKRSRHMAQDLFLIKMEIF